MKKFIGEILVGLKSLFIGMRVTIAQFFKPTVTVHYPRQTLKIPPRFRGHIELVKDPTTGKAICFACKLCERACPSDCITVEGAKLEGAKKRSVTKYVLDFTKCSLCGSCVEACRDGAIQFSREYNLAGFRKEDYVMDLFKRLEDEAKKAGAASPAPTTAAAEPAPATLQAPEQKHPATAAPPSSGSMAPQPSPTLSPE
jgi:NADH-quinone oxidoreductase subunit I